MSDAVLLAMKLAAAVLAVIALVLLHRAQAAADIQCPAPDHPVYAQVIYKWICGDSLNVGVKSK